MRGRWRRPSALALIAALLIVLGFSLRHGGLPDAANVAQLVSIIPVAAEIRAWGRVKPSSAVTSPDSREQPGGQSHAGVVKASQPGGVGSDGQALPITATRVRGLWARRAVALLTGVGLLVLVLGIDAALGDSGGLGSQSADGQAILEKLVGQEEFLAATATYGVHVVIHNHSILPHFLGGIADSTSILQGVGTDSALVNFGSLTGGDVVRDGGSIRVFLPLPVIARPRLDTAKLSITTQSGVLYRLGQVIAQQPSAEQPLLVLADATIRTQAQRSALVLTAEQNTRFFLRGFLAQYNIHHVVIEFVK